jgi:hypothetical protein
MDCRVKHSRFMPSAAAQEEDTCNGFILLSKFVNL